MLQMSSVVADASRGCYGCGVEQAFTCPHCETVLDVVPGPEPQDVVCPHCSGLTVIPAATVDAAAQPSQTEAPGDDREDELSGLRIRQLAAAKRAAYRSRSYCVVAAIVCVVAVVQLVWNGVATIRAIGFGMRAIAYLLVAATGMWGAVYFFRKAMEFDREAKQSTLPTATGEPDFAPLGDGRERWKNLEDVR